MTSHYEALSVQAQNSSAVTRHSSRVADLALIAQLRALKIDWTGAVSDAPIKCNDLISTEQQRELIIERNRLEAEPAQVLSFYKVESIPTGQVLPRNNWPVCQHVAMFYYSDGVRIRIRSHKREGILLREIDTWTQGVDSQS
jgi:hypothetical protein